MCVSLVNWLDQNASIPLTLHRGYDPHDCRRELARAGQPRLKYERPVRQRSEATKREPGVAGRLALALRVECGALLE